MFDDYDSAPVTQDGALQRPPSRRVQPAGAHAVVRIPSSSTCTVASRESSRSVRAAAGAEFSNAFGAAGLGFEDDRFLDFDDDDYAGALAAYESESQVRVLFENGAGHETPGAPLGRFEASYDAWPPPEATPDPLVPRRRRPSRRCPGHAGCGRLPFRPGRGQHHLLWSAGLRASPRRCGTSTGPSSPRGDVLSYLTDPFESDTVIAGAGYADLWIRSDVEDAAVQVTPHRGAPRRHRDPRAVRLAAPRPSPAAGPRQQLRGRPLVQEVRLPADAHRRVRAGSGADPPRWPTRSEPTRSCG